jgi:hypothetical protein
MRITRPLHQLVAPILAVLLTAWLAFSVYLLTRPAFASELQSARPRPKIAGLILLLGAIGIGTQLVFTSRKGYVYCGRTETISKKDNAVWYRRWFVIHVLFVGSMLAWSITLLR